MGVNKIGFLSGWKLKLVEFFKLLIEHGCLRKQDIAKFYITAKDDLKLLDISEQEWQQGVDELVASGKAKVVTSEDGLSIKLWDVNDGKCKYHIYPLDDEAGDFSIHDVLDALRRHLDLDVKGKWAPYSYSVGWLHKAPGHHRYNNDLSDSYILIGKIEHVCDLEDIEEGFAVPVEFNDECPPLLSFLTVEQPTVYMLTDDC